MTTISITQGAFQNMKNLWRKVKCLYRTHLCYGNMAAAFVLMAYGIPPISGGTGGGGKESERANDLARQERMRADEQAAALRAQQEAAAAQLMREIEAAVAQSPQEQANLASLGRVQPEREQQALAVSRGGPALNTPLGLALQERLLTDLNRNPDDTFAPNLQLLQGEVGKFASRRGIVGSGLELEKLGRTGVELAIQQAQAREQQRASQVERAISGNTALETIGASRRGELSGYEQELQSLEDARRAREIGARTGASQTGANIRSTGNLTALERLNAGDARAGQYESGQLTADRTARASQQAGIGKLVGTAAGVGASFIPGVGPALSPLILAGLNGNSISIPSTTSVPGAGQLRAAQRQPSSRGGGYGEFYERFQ